MTTARVPWLVILAGLVAPVIAADHVSCTTSSDLEGQPASVTCHFPENISVSRDHFRIYRYDFDRQHRLPEIVGDCYWNDGERTPRCGTVEGFQFDNTFSDTATLTIPVSSQHHAGVYRCDYISLNYSPEYGCDLYVRGRTINCTGATVYEGDPANVACHYNSDLSVTHDDFYIARWRPGHHDHRDVLTCLWLEPDLTQSDCFVHPAFKLIDKVSRTVTIHIPVANQSHVGRYFCDIVPTRRDVARKLCHVEVKEKTITTSALAASSTMTTAATDHTATTAPAADLTSAGSAQHHPQGEQETPGDMPLEPLVYLALALAGITAVAFVTVAVVILIRRQRDSTHADSVNYSEKELSARARTAATV